jgi:hypothetical protein
MINLKIFVAAFVIACVGGALVPTAAFLLFGSSGCQVDEFGYCDNNGPAYLYAATDVGYGMFWTGFTSMFDAELWYARLEASR